MKKKAEKHLEAKHPTISRSCQVTLILPIVIKIALATDFSKFENQRNAKNLIESLISKANLQNRALTRSASLPPRKNSKLSTPNHSKKSTQKSQPSKSVPPTQKPDRQTSLPKPSPVQEVSQPTKTACD